MKVNLKTIFYILALIALFCLTLAVIHYGREMRSEPKSDADTVVEFRYDTIVIRDTVKETKPVIVKVLKTDTITKDTILTTLQKQYNDTLCNNSDSVVLKSFISGVDAKRDSMQVTWKKHEKTKIVTIDHYIDRYVEKKQPIIAFKPTVAVGYDPMNKCWSGVVGFGLVLNW